MRILIKKLGQVALGDRWDGYLRVIGDCLYIGQDKGKFVGIERGGDFSNYTTNREIKIELGRWTVDLMRALKHKVTTEFRIRNLSSTWLWIWRTAFCLVCPHVLIRYWYSKVIAWLILMFVLKFRLIAMRPPWKRSHRINSPMPPFGGSSKAELSSEGSSEDPGLLEIDGLSVRSGCGELTSTASRACWDGPSG